MVDTEPSPGALAAFDALDDPGTPLTAGEVAAELGCARRTAYDRLRALSDAGHLRTKKVGARGRVWWRPAAGTDEPALLEAVLDATAGGVLVLDGRGRVRRANDRAAAVLGRSREALAGARPCWAFRDEDGRLLAPGACPVSRALGTGARVADWRGAVERPDGERSWVRVDAVPVSGGADGARLVVGVADVTRRRERAERVRRQRDELARLARVNSVVRRVDRGVVAAETRAEIAERVCEVVAASGPYRFAVVGEFSASFERFTPEATAGDGEAYLDDVLREDGPRLGDGPGATAVRTGEVQAVQRLDAVDDPARRAAAERHGVASYAAVPLVYRDVAFGVLGVFAREPAAFDERERALLAELGETVGHAINAIERREALLADTVVEVELRERGPVAAWFREQVGEGTATVDRTVVLSGERVLQYYTVRGADAGTLRTALERVDRVEHVRVVEEREGAVRLEVRTTGPTAASTLATYGGHTVGASYGDGEVRVVAHLPYGTDVRRVLEAVREVYPELTLVSQTTRDRQTPPDVRAATLDGLTDRQRTVLEVAHHAGYFEWPRESTGEELAEGLGVASPTFHQHVRAATRTLVAALFGD